MIKKDDIQKLLNEALTDGADFAEIFLEDTTSKTTRALSGEIISINDSQTFGAGIRLLQGTDEVYGHTNDVSFESLQTLLNQLKPAFKGEAKTVTPLGDKKPYVYLIKKPHYTISNAERSAKLIELSNIIKTYDERIVQAVAMLLETEQKVWIANTNGLYQDDVRIYTRVILQAVAKEGENMQSAFEGPGRHMGFEIFDEIDCKALATEVAHSAILQLSAEDIESQVMPVVIHNGFGGVIFHEALGHPLEAVAIAKGLSPFVGKLGEVVGTPIVNARDNGTISTAWGSTNFDDEGYPTQDNVLIEKGVLKGYLVDPKNGAKLGLKHTGSSRRESYKYAPVSRMNSTFIENGTEDYQDIIKDTKYGLFAKKMGGGTVNPATGEYNFAVQEGYMIEDGKLTKAVRGAMLIGHGKDVLFKIDRIANNLELGQGMCGASSGSIPVDVGQPTIRVTSMTVGGSGGRK